MQTIERRPSAFEPEGPSPHCPVDHTAWSQQKTARVVEPPGPPIERDAAGVWHVRGFEEARAILRSADTRQAGFKAELLDQIPHAMNQPILYQEGKPHQQQRKQTARFFTPKTVSTTYRQFMERLADQLIAHFRREGRADLSQLSLKLAVRVAGEVVGLTNSLLPGMERRLIAFFDEGPTRVGWRPGAILHALRMQRRVAWFYYLDVKPAIQARKRQPREDVISHLLALNYRDSEILTECITYGAAGMATTREFISVAAWHLLEQPALRARYLAAPEAERQRMLEEILRLEPVVGHLYRRATADLHLESDGAPVTIPQGALIDVHIYGTNADPRIVGEHPLMLCPGRELKGDRVPAAMMGFGDGHHRCPGSFIALQETDIFLQRLLALEGLHIERGPGLRWNDLIASYELRNFSLVIKRARA